MNWATHLLAVWKGRRQLDDPKLREEEAEFMPGALALQTAPASPTATWISRVMAACFVSLAAWSVIGRMDIVVTAPSIVIAGQRNQLLSSPATTAVRAIHVREGSRVSAGDLLMELDATLPAHEGQEALANASLATRQLAVGQALLTALQAGGPAPDFKLEPVALAMARAAWSEHAARRERLRAELDHQRDALVLAVSDANSLHELLQQQLVSRQAWSERDLQRLQLEARVAALQGEIAQQQAEFQRTQQESIDRARAALERAQLTASKASAVSASYLLRAPLAGTVHRVAVHTVGGVVGAAQGLVEPVPDGGPLELEANIANKDIGFVKVGQTVAVKLDAYNASHHGTLGGRIVYLSPDAVHEERAGETRAVSFKARIAIDGVPPHFPVTPGMTASADIRTGSRTLAAYLLSPLARSVRDSMREP